MIRKGSDLCKFQRFSDLQNCRSNTNSGSLFTMSRSTQAVHRFDKNCTELGLSGLLNSVSRLSPRTDYIASLRQVNRVAGVQYRSSSTRKSQLPIAFQPASICFSNSRPRFPTNKSSLSVCTQKAHFCNSPPGKLQSTFDYSKPDQSPQHNGFWITLSVKVIINSFGSL